MAQPTQQVDKARRAVRAFMAGLAGMDEAKETLIDLGAPTFIEFLDEVSDDDPPVPLYDISSDDVIDALGPNGALKAINDVLDANNGAHRKALRKLL
jgi:hypothetical protein